MSRDLLKGVWAKAIRSSADPERVRHFLELLSAAGAGRLGGASADQAKVLAAVLGGSTALSIQLSQNPEWIELLEKELLRYPRRKQGLQQEVNAWLKPLLASGDKT